MIWREGVLTKALTEELTKKTKPVAIDFGEITIDSIFDSQFVKEVPILKTIVTAVEVGLLIRDRHFAKKLLVFLKDFQTGNCSSDEINTFKNKLESDEKFKKKTIETIMIVLDRYVETEKSLILSKLLQSYISGKTTIEQFYNLTFILDMLLHEDLFVLKDFYNQTQLLQKGANPFIDYSKDISKGIHSSVTRLRVQGFLRSPDAAKLSGGPIDSYDVRSQVTEFGKTLCEAGLVHLSPDMAQ